MKVLGILLIVFGVIDLLGGWFLNFDLWGGFIGIELPEIIWTYSGYIEVAVGWLFLRAGTEELDTGFKMMAGSCRIPEKNQAWMTMREECERV